MQLISTPDYPPMFSEAGPQVTTVPIYMRLREHHCVSPQEPIDCGGSDDGFDDGMKTAYYPSMRMMRESGVGTACMVRLARSDRVLR